jgi:hypothetical protein
MSVSSTAAAVASRLAAAWLAVSVVAVTAQETNELVRIDFRNRIPGVVDAPAFDFDGISKLEVPFLALLYVGPDTNSFRVIGSLIPFLTGTDAGYWHYEMPIEIIPDFHPQLGETIWFQVQIFQYVNRGPFPEPIYVGASPIYSMVVTNYVMPMVGLESFKLEPERLEISVEVDQAIIQWQYLAAARYELQSTSDLKPPVSWTPIFEWSGIGDNGQIFSVTNAVTTIPQFYRLERRR